MSKMTKERERELSIIRYSANVKANIVKTLSELLSKHFLRRHKSYKLFNERKLFFLCALMTCSVNKFKFG